MLNFFLQTVSFLLARTPEAVLRLLAAGLGDIIYYIVPGRRRLLLSNLDHAFPDKSAAWKRRIARTSCHRLAETVLMSLTFSALPPARLKAIMGLSPSATAFFEDYNRRRRPVLMCLPHMAGWELLTAVPLHPVASGIEFGVVFRPLDHPAADAWVKRTRERFGMKLLSRKSGLQEAIRLLRRNGIAGLLFDQNAGHQGALTTLFGRVCSTTEMPNLLVARNGAELWGIYSRRTAFWRAELEVCPISLNGPTDNPALALNRWLESLLTQDDARCASWLWLHNRWRHQDEPYERFVLHSRRTNLLTEDMAARGLTTLPRRTRFFIRLPNWLGDVVMALPLLRALRTARPDVEFTLIGKAAFRPLVDVFGLADRFEPLPPHGPGYFLHFYRLRHSYPDCYILFTNSVRGDLEARLTGCRQRFGIVRVGKRRPLLTHPWNVPAGFDERSLHQLQLWTDFLRHYGLAAPIDLTSLNSKPQTPNSKLCFGFIPGSENSPEKRWPVSHWRTLVEKLLTAHPDAAIVLFGTAGDRPITEAVAQGFDPARIQNLAGQTDLPGFMARLRECHLLVTNDTGGMHLANALGVPLIAMFGPTNPLRTGPVFASPYRILQPAGCPPAGGASLADLAPETVFAAVNEELQGG